MIGRKRVPFDAPSEKGERSGSLVPLGVGIGHWLQGVLLALLLSSTASAKLIPFVPDANQPPTNTLGVPHVSNYCAPMAAVNITEYWDVVVGHPNAAGVNGGLGVTTAAEYIGYFMDTNDFGDSTRANGTMFPSANGTYTIDQKPGFFEFVRWDSANLFTTPPPALPPGKNGYAWKFGYTDVLMASDSAGFEFCAAAIDSGFPVKIDFLYWNPQITGVLVVDPASGETIEFFEWGDTIYSSTDPDHEEDWNLYQGEEGIGHAVTGVGYFRNYDPDGTGYLPQGDYIVVHDNWWNTPRNVAVLWTNWNAVISVDPNVGPTIDRIVDLTPYFDWGAISTFSGLSPPGGMGIWSPAHSGNFYFPSDTLGGSGGYPLAWMIPGVHWATRYGPANVRTDVCPVSNSIVTVPDQNSRSCSLQVRVPPANLIDEANDLNVIQISPGETMTIAINKGCVDVMVFLASCDGYVETPDWPSLSQPLEVWLSYNDGTVDTVVFDDIHPAGRLDLDDPYYPPSWIFVYGNEVFVCDPAYFDLPGPYFDGAHSEAWHWYTLYPNAGKLLNSLTFVGIQAGEHSELYISALSYRCFCVGTDVDLHGGGAAPPAAVRLLQTSPNPFNPMTSIRYSIPADAQVSMAIYDLHGRQVRTLVDDHRAAGTYTTQWNGRSETGEPVGSGVYFCRLQAGRHAETRKIMLLK